MMSTTPSLPKLSSVRDSSSTSSGSQQKKKIKVEPDISDNTCQPTIGGNIKKPLSLFKCCVCVEYINPPILQCRNSHVFCKSCRQQFKSPPKCPTCTVTLPREDSRYTSLEQIAESLGLLFPCKNSTNGCNVTLLLTERQNHEELCGLGSFKCYELGCKWSGSRDQLVQHFLDEHRYERIDSNSYCITIDCKLQSTIVDERNKGKRNTYWRTLLTHKNQNFVLIRKFMNNFKGQYQFKILVLFVGEQRVADQFKYKIQVMNESNGTRLLWEDKPISIRSMNTNTWFLLAPKNNCLVLDYFMIVKLSVDNILKININIESEDN